MKKDISENYILIQGWMITNLNLKGNDLLTFALIYGFSQDGHSKFTGSLDYVCNWLNVSKPTAIASLKSLVEKNLIIKEVEVITNVSFNRYKVNLQVVNKLNGGGKETLLGGGKDSLMGGSKETLPNNINNNNTKLDNTNNKLNKFISEVENFKNQYPESMIDDFINYWTETNSKGKMKFELKETFEVSRRLAYWQRNENKFSRTQNNYTPKGQQPTNLEQMNYNQINDYAKEIGGMNLYMQVMLISEENLPEKIKVIKQYQLNQKFNNLNGF